MPPRIALLGFSIECNRFAPTATEADFRGPRLVGGADLLSEARSPAPRMLGELPGFMSAMDAACPWVPVPSLLAMAEPNGPVDRVIEVDAPGLTSPILSRFPWRHMPRPVLPIDDAAEWTPPA